ncbi:hypothetical protein [Corynebacterium canis]|uniref:hypothetical protein n=1 Tax=Corynebacterium canis TaxID=679663 RepID=UPI0016487552|nr:hypothetical protein [Corynebacterium canis]
MHTTHLGALGRNPQGQASAKHFGSVAQMMQATAQDKRSRAEPSRNPFPHQHSHPYNTTTPNPFNTTTPNPFNTTTPNPFNTTTPNPFNTIAPKS